MKTQRVVNTELGWLRVASCSGVNQQCQNGDVGANRTLPAVAGGAGPHGAPREHCACLGHSHGPRKGPVLGCRPTWFKSWFCHFLASPAKWENTVDPQGVLRGFKKSMVIHTMPGTQCVLIDGQLFY